MNISSISTANFQSKFVPSKFAKNDMKEFSTNVAHNYKSYSDMISLANLKKTVDVKNAEEYGRIRHLITPEAKAEGRHIDFISESTIL